MTLNFCVLVLLLTTLVVSEIYMDDGVGIGWVVGAEW